MEYCIYKFNFRTGVHFGNGMLNDSTYTFKADQLFSALYIEAKKLGMEAELFENVRTGKLLFSDAFPYINQSYMIPKPLLHLEIYKEKTLWEKKKYKEMKFLPVEKLPEFLSGTMDLSQNDMDKLGVFEQHTKASVHMEEETVPYRVGTFYFGTEDKNGMEYKSGLYVIIGCQEEKQKQLMEELLESLSYTGIGGKKSSGLGKFELHYGKMPEEMKKRMKEKSERSLLLSTALPGEKELESALINAEYLLEKRSGFVASDEYADEWRRKKDLYVFAAGSCFENRFSGDIYDVSDYGRHAVYRYAKPLFMEV